MLDDMAMPHVPARQVELRLDPSDLARVGDDDVLVACFPALEEIEKRKAKFPDLTAVNEIWIVETMSYETDSYLRFEHYENGALVGSLDFQGSELFRQE